METEIRSAILEQYGADIDFRYSRGVNRFRIYPSGNSGVEIQQELSAYYEESGADAMQKPLAVLWFLVKKHPAGKGCDSFRKGSGSNGSSCLSG